MVNIIKKSTVSPPPGFSKMDALGYGSEEFNTLFDVHTIKKVP